MFWGCRSRASTSSVPPRAAPVFLLGTDRLGRDVLSRIIYGTRDLAHQSGCSGIAVSFLIGITSAASRATSRLGRHRDPAASSR
jgi:peptide/nickel transport system permease protein